jgi:RNA polymerase sigma factor (sigma-70 family)
VDDAELVDRASRGDRDAFGALYVQYRGDIHDYLRRRGRNEHLAEDLTHETFIRALKNLGTYEHRGRCFRAYLTTIARNLLADHHKSCRHRRELSAGTLSDSDHWIDRAAPATYEPWTAVRPGRTATWRAARSPASPRGSAAASNCGTWASTASTRPPTCSVRTPGQSRPSPTAPSPRHGEP